MTSITEKSWFKWAIMGGSFFAIFSVIGIFSVTKYLDFRKIEAARIQKKKAQDDYEERTRAGMLRIRQNLKLDHYLAAYKNFQLTPPPPRKEAFATEDYLEVLHRIGNGLLKNQLYKEAEEVFTAIRDYDDQFEKANESIGRIESKRRLESAHQYFAQVEKLMEEKRYQDALGDLQKTEQELGSLQNLQYDDIKDEWIKLRKLIGMVKFRVYADDADRLIKEAARRLKVRDFKAVDSAMSKASNLTGRAAFFNPSSEEITSLRQRLFDLNAELGVLLPNLLPVTNGFTKDMVGKLPFYFYLEGANFDLTAAKTEHTVTIGLEYFMRAPETYYIVRYRIYYYDNGDSYNGHYLTDDLGKSKDPSKNASKNDGDMRSVEFKQEIPERFWNTPIRRIEIKIFNDQDQLISFLTRAFRRDASS